MDGLQQLTTVEQVARERGVEASSLPYRSRAKSREARETVVAPAGAVAVAGETA